MYGNEILRLMPLGMTAEIKALHVAHEHLRELIGDPHDLTYYKWKTVTGALGHMLQKEPLIHSMHDRVTAIDGYWDATWELVEEDWEPYTRHAGSEDGAVLAERVRRLEEAMGHEEVLVVD